MYLREKKIKLLRIRNVLLTVFAVFEVLVRGYYIISEFVYYRDDPDTALHAVSMPGSLIIVPIAVAVLIWIGISRRRIGNAAFYSSYFEGDLDGYIPCADLAEVTGFSEQRVRRQLRACLRHYMKDFTLGEKDGTAQVILSSKTALCQCKSCGAEIEKRIFFTGECPYCKSSDLHAAVLTGERVVSISNDVSAGVQKPAYYMTKHLALKEGLFVGLLLLGGLLSLLGLMVMLSEIPHYFDHDYWVKELFDPDNHLYDFDQIRAHILDNILFSASLFAIFTPLFIWRLIKTVSISTAQRCAAFFANLRRPIIPASQLKKAVSSKKPERVLNRVRGAIRRGYLKNCTLEKHGGKLSVALAKKVVKDQCPSCGAPITGAVDESYQCRYCGNRITQVVVKK